MRAVIFDMDGVISDTQSLYSQCESIVLANCGIDIVPEEITRRFAGISDHAQFTELFDEAGMEMPPLEEIVAARNQLMFAIPSEDIKPMPGALELIAALHARAVPTAVASASAMDFIYRILKTLKQVENFSAIVSVDEVEHGKPEPDVFLVAAQRMGMPPRDCIVIEDGYSGMLAAKRAEMKCIGLLTHVSMQDSPADLNVRDLRELSVEKLLKL